MKIVKSVEPSSLYTTFIGLSTIMGNNNWSRNIDYDRGRGCIMDYDKNYASFDDKFKNAIGWNGHGNSNRYNNDNMERTFAIVNDDKLMVEQMERSSGSNVIVSTGYLKNAVEYVARSMGREHSEKFSGVAMKLLDILCYINENGFDVLECDTTTKQREFYNRFDTGVNRNSYRQSRKRLPLFLSQRYSKYTWKNTFIELYGEDVKTSLTSEQWELWETDIDWAHRKGLSSPVISSELVITGV
jgi:hypothetical protein